MGGISTTSEHAVWVLEVVDIAVVLIVSMLLIAGADVRTSAARSPAGLAGAFARTGAQ
jgi:hypothetical protein